MEREGSRGGGSRVWRGRGVGVEGVWVEREVSRGYKRRGGFRAELFWW